MAGQFLVDIKGLAELQQALRNEPGIAEPTLQKAIEGSEALLAKHRRGNVPIRTGTLNNTFQFTPGRLMARYYPTKKYAIYVHDGTGIYGPHGTPIVPKTKKALYWKGAAHPVRSVKGMRARPFMPAIAAEAKPDIDELFAQALQIITRDIAAAGPHL